MESLQGEIQVENLSFTKPTVLGEKKKNISSYRQMEIPKSPNRAMEFLSRSWSHADFLQTFSSNNLFLHSYTDEHVDDNITAAGATHVSTINQENTKCDVVKMDFKPTKSWFRGKSFTSLFRSQKEKKKEERRLHTAELHAALSLTQLAAAIAGISSSSSMCRNECSSEDMGNVISSAAALVTNVCAEVAESLGAHRARVRAAVDSGMAIQTPMDMIAVTATAATCLRGASLLKSRATAVPLSRVQEMLKITAEICTIMPSGREECTRVSVYLKHDHLMFRFRKKYLGGALTSAKEYQVTNITEERMEHQGSSFLCLNTKNGIIKLLFEDAIQSKILISTILNLLEMRSPCWEGSHTH
ncbi:hypothetical protein ACP275_06G011800 [Erythranthe tilingii]